MVRLVKKESKAPFEIKVGTDSIWICMCGLSNNQPYCDDSHKKTIDEDNKNMTKCELSIIHYLCIINHIGDISITILKRLLVSAMYKNL
jgi:CDGSH-type Zn-finger protein